MPKRVLFTCIVVVVLITLWGFAPESGHAQTPKQTPTTASTLDLNWSRPELVSGLLRGSWFPQIAVDPLGRVNVAWSVTGEAGAHGEVLYFSRRERGAWTRPNDIEGPFQFIIRSALAADHLGYLHLLYDNNATASHVLSKYDDAFYPNGWVDRTQIGGFQQAYMFDMKIDSKGIIHVLYGNNTGICAGCFNLFYRNSADNGATWSSSYEMTSSLIERTRMQLEIDSNDNLYAAWDNIDSNESPRSAGFSFSTDGGKTWSTPAQEGPPGEHPLNTAVGVDGSGNVLLVYRVQDAPDIYYQVSNNGGRIWGLPQTINGIYSASQYTGFDKYSMATDSSGKVYLALAGRQNRGQGYTGLYVLAWDGSQWSNPVSVADNSHDFPEYPSIVVSEGNLLHLVWTKRGNSRIFNLPDETYNIYYSEATSSSPAQTPVPVATAQSTFTPAPPSPTNTATPTSTPLPIQTTPTGNAIPTLPQLPIALAIVPIVLLFGLILLLRSILRRV